MRTYALNVELLFFSANSDRDTKTYFMKLQMTRRPEHELF